MAIMTTTVGIAKLKNNLSYYLKQIKQGYEILVTDHGEVVAKISSCVPKNNKSTAEEKIKALKDILDSGSKEDLDAKSKDLMESMQKMGSKMYENTPQPEAGAAPGAEPAADTAAEPTPTESKKAEEGEVVN